MLWIQIGLLILTWRWCAADCYLFPPGKELVYRWSAKMVTGTELPSEVVQTWGFTATVAIQQQAENLTYFQVREVKEMEEDEKGEEDLDPVRLPFVASYSDSGTLEGLEVSEADPVWSVNLKRALAAALQLRQDALHQPSVVADEMNHFGRCSVEYERSEMERGLLKIRKIVDHESCMAFPQQHVSNCALSVCTPGSENMMTSDSEREYLVDPKSEVPIKNMNATGRILVQPYQANAEAHYSKVVESFTLVSTEDLKERGAIKTGDDSISVDITYEHVKLDPTYGKRPSSKEDVVNQVYKQLGELSDSLSSWEVGLRGLDNETSFHILDLMCWLDLHGWEELHNTISLGTSYRQETIQNLFWDLLPHVGSRSAIHFIKKLITTGRIKGFLAGRMLATIPFYLREYSEQLLVECEDFLELNSGATKVTKDIQHYAILSFASIIAKTCKTNCRTETLDKYAKIYLDKLIESPAHEDKMVYLQGLGNMELMQVLDYLSPVISGQIKSTKHVRFLAIWSTLHTVYTSPAKIYEVYWPLFVNRSEPLEIRVASLTLLMMSKPSTSRFFNIYLQMQAEPSEQLYNYYYTTIHSLSKTNYPCYLNLRGVSARFARFVGAKSRHWATGNYLLDFEDTDRAYGGMFQTLLIASELTGLPNVFMFIVEQHAIGHSRMYSVYLKMEGFYSAYNEELRKISKNAKAQEQIPKVLEILKKLNVQQRYPENVHLELILKIDSRTILLYHSNQASFKNWTETIYRMSQLYMEFSVNYQSLSFPQIISTTKPTDLGTPAILKIRAASLMSARGSISQENEGRVRNADLDFRYSWNGVSTLRTYSPFTNKWYGADRCRNIHVRFPFATQLIQPVLKADKSVYKLKAVRHREFVTGTRLGLVWHSSTRYVNKNPSIKEYKNMRDEWTMDSEDLGVRLAAGVFDCSSPDNIPDALHLLKNAFLSNHKNYNMLPGGAIILGILALKDHLQFQPKGVSCGVMLYFTPLESSQVESELNIEGTGNWRLSMNRADGLLWEIQAQTKRSEASQGDKEFTFKLYRAPSLRVTVAHVWRVIQFEGAFIIPSKFSGISQRKTSLTGYAFVSWGDASPSRAGSAATLDLRLLPRPNETEQQCSKVSPICLQAASDLAARQTAILQYSNIPLWLKTAAHALFPEQFQTESSQTQIAFDYPVALLPWNTKGLCAVNSGSVLTLDNATIPFNLSDCYTIAVADCSERARFSVQVKKTNNVITARVLGDGDEIELLSNGSYPTYAIVNGKLIENSKQGYSQSWLNDTRLSVRERAEGMMEIELGTGIMLYITNNTVVILVPTLFRGRTCGLCGDFNSDTIHEPVPAFADCHYQSPSPSPPVAPQR